jgi:hypothetical protein
VPTTRILKVSPNFAPDITRQEAVLHQIAAEVGVEAAETRDLVFEIEGVRIWMTGVLRSRKRTNPVGASFRASPGLPVRKMLAVPDYLAADRSDLHGFSRAVLFPGRQ